MIPPRRVPDSIDPAANLATINLPRVVESRILKRWSKWEPCVTQSMLASNIIPADRINQMNLYRATHRRAIIDALRAGISWRVIISDKLDDPRLSHESRQEMFHAAIERRRVRADNVTNIALTRNRNKFLKGESPNVTVRS